MPIDRTVPLTGVHNFRDYGGYPVAGGGRVRTGLLYRSGQHVDASADDLAAIDALGIRHVIDMRGASERRSYPCRRAEGFDAQVIFYDGETAALAPHVEAGGGSEGGVMDADAAHARMEKLYADLPNREPVLWIMRRYFDILALGKGASLIHCLAGKDRTGMAVALLHHALGVSRDDAMADFLLTNTTGDMDARVAAGAATIRAKWGDLSDDTIRVLMGVDERYLAAMYRSVESRYGSLDDFLRDELDVDDAKRAALRLHLIEA